MKFDISSEDIFGFIKPVVDVHTMGVYTIANLLRDCGYKVIVAKDEIKAIRLYYNWIIKAKEKVANQLLFLCSVFFL